MFPIRDYWLILNYFHFQDSNFSILEYLIFNSLYVNHITYYLSNYKFIKYE